MFPKLPNFLSNTYDSTEKLEDTFMNLDDIRQITTRTVFSLAWSSRNLIWDDMIYDDDYMIAAFFSILSDLPNPAHAGTERIYFFIEKKATFQHVYNQWLAFLTNYLTTYVSSKLNMIPNIINSSYNVTEKQAIILRDITVCRSNSLINSCISYQKARNNLFIRRYSRLQKLPARLAAWPTRCDPRTALQLL